MFKGKRYPAHSTLKRSASDSFLRSPSDKHARLTSAGRHSIFLPKAMACRQPQKSVSQFNHVKVAGSGELRIESRPDRNDSTSGASNPKDSRHSAETRCFQDFRSSARLRRSAPRKIAFRRSASTGLECAVSKSIGNLSKCDRLYIWRVGNICYELLDVREIGDVFRVVFQDDWDTGQARPCCLPPNIHHHPTHHRIIHPGKVCDFCLAHYVALQQFSRGSDRTGFSFVSPLVAATSAG